MSTTATTRAARSRQGGARMVAWRPRPRAQGGRRGGERIAGTGLERGALLSHDAGASAGISLETRSWRRPWRVLPAQERGPCSSDTRRAYGAAAAKGRSLRPLHFALTQVFIGSCACRRSGRSRICTSRPAATSRWTSSDCTGRATTAAWPRPGTAWSPLTTSCSPQATSRGRASPRRPWATSPGSAPAQDGRSWSRATMTTGGPLRRPSSPRCCRHAPTRSRRPRARSTGWASSARAAATSRRRRATATPAPRPTSRNGSCAKSASSSPPSPRSMPWTPTRDGHAACASACSTTRPCRQARAPAASPRSSALRADHLHLRPPPWHRARSGQGRRRVRWRHLPLRQLRPDRLHAHPGGAHPLVLAALARRGCRTRMPRPRSRHARQDPQQLAQATQAHGIPPPHAHQGWPRHSQPPPPPRERQGQEALSRPVWTPRHPDPDGAPGRGVWTTRSPPRCGDQAGRVR